MGLAPPQQALLILDGTKALYLPKIIQNIKARLWDDVKQLEFTCALLTSDVCLHFGSVPTDAFPSHSPKTSQCYSPSSIDSI